MKKKGSDDKEEPFFVFARRNGKLKKIPSLAFQKKIVYNQYKPPGVNH